MHQMLSNCPENQSSGPECWRMEGSGQTPVRSALTRLDVLGWVPQTEEAASEKRIGVLTVHVGSECVGTGCLRSSAPSLWELLGRGTKHRLKLQPPRGARTGKCSSTPLD